MLPKDRNAAYLWDMLDAAQAILSFVKGKSFHDYSQDRMLRGAIERHIEIIGEAANKISEALRTAHPEIPWRKIIAQRHVIAHEYGEIENELICKVATQAVPELISQLEKIIPDSPEME